MVGKFWFREVAKTCSDWVGAQAEAGEMGDSSMITPVDFDAVFANNSALSLGSAFLQHAGPEPEGDSPLPQLTSGRSTGSSLGGSRPNSRDRLRPLSRTPSLLQTPESSQGTSIQTLLITRKPKGLLQRTIR